MSRLSDSLAIPVRGEHLTLEEIIRSDDVNALNDLMRDTPDLVNTEWICISFQGQRCLVGILGAAIHFRALSCLKRIPVRRETYGRKKGGPTAAHIACAEGWHPAIVHLIDKGAPLDGYDSEHRSPLAYLADRCALRAFHCVVDELNRRGNCFGLNGVYIGTAETGSLDFAGYCALTGNRTMLNFCQYSGTLKMLGPTAMDEARRVWHTHHPRVREPHALVFFCQNRDLKRDLDISDIFQPIVQSSNFAPIDSERSIPIGGLVRELESITQSLVPLRQWILLAPPAGMPSDPVRWLTEFPRHFLYRTRVTEQVVFEFSCHNALKTYFTMLIKEHFDHERGYLRPRVGTRADWFGFGVVLAHVGAIGCHYLWPFPLDPLVWAAIRQNPRDATSAHDIEGYFLEVDQEMIRGLRDEAITSFHVSLENSTIRYREELQTRWKRHMDRTESIYTAIRTGFFAEPTADFRDRESGQWKTFCAFRKAIEKLPVPGIRLWFEGLGKSHQVRGKGSRRSFEGDGHRGQEKVFPLWWKAFKRNVTFCFRIAPEADARFWQPRLEAFVRSFLDWAKSDENGPQFVAALCGVSSIIPMRRFRTKIVVVGDEDAWASGIDWQWTPKLLLPKQKALIFASEEVYGMFAEMAENVAGNDEAGWNRIFEPENPDILRPYLQKVPRIVRRKTE
jgi:hypothetical protein